MKQNTTNYKKPKVLLSLEQFKADLADPVKEREWRRYIQELALEYNEVEGPDEVESEEWPSKITLAKTPETFYNVYGLQHTGKREYAKIHSTH